MPRRASQRFPGLPGPPSASLGLPGAPRASPGLVPFDHFRKQSWVLLQIGSFRPVCAFPCAPNRKTVVLFLCWFLEFVVGFVLWVAKQLWCSCAFFCALVCAFSCAGFWSLWSGLCSGLQNSCGVLVLFLCSSLCFFLCWFLEFVVGFVLWVAKQLWCSCAFFVL